MDLLLKKLNMLLRRQVLYTSLAKLMEQTGCKIDKINELASEKIYGIVFLEDV